MENKNVRPFVGQTTSLNARQRFELAKHRLFELSAPDLDSKHLARAALARLRNVEAGYCGGTFDQTPEALAVRAEIEVEQIEQQGS